MTNEFTAIIEQDGHWFIAYSPEIPGANGQGKTKEEARESLAEAIRLILEDRREDGLRVCHQMRSATLSALSEEKHPPSTFAKAWLLFVRT